MTAAIASHAGRGDGEASTAIHQRHLRRLLPSSGTGPGARIAFGRGSLARLLLADGYATEGIGVSRKRVTISRASGVGRAARGDYRTVLNVCLAQFAAVTAADVLEHLTSNEVRTFDVVHGAPALTHEYRKILDLPGTPR